MSKTNLFDDFSEVSAKAWKQKIQFDLKGADYNDTLVWESPEGIKVKPFYKAEDIAANVLPYPISHKKWNIGQTIYAGKASLANEKALDVLGRGAEALFFSIPSDDIKVEKVLDGIDLETVPLYFDFQFLSVKVVNQIIDFVAAKTVEIYLNIDIIGNLARTGNWFYTLKRDHEILKEILNVSQKNPGIHVIGVDVSLYQNAGSNCIQQLAYALSHANEYLNYLDDDKKLLKQVQGVTFKVAVGSNYFFEIAKLRALRLLWNTLASEYDIETDCQIIAIPSKRNKTLYDYNMNMLRTTTESMSAILGGADTICNSSYDAIYHKSNEFSERIARNQLLILKEESYFDKVSDPADGSYYIGTLTDQMAKKALELFKDIEENGGFLHQLKAHTIQKKIRESAKKEQEKFNGKEEILVGTNKYEVAADRMKEDLELYPFVKTNTRKTLIEPIIEKRLAAVMEQKRLENE
ncbi:MAG: methylmalonyl-CoA mutase subunit beta [Saonia sp.]